MSWSRVAPHTELMSLGRRQETTSLLLPDADGSLDAVSGTAVSSVGELIAELSFL